MTLGELNCEGRDKPMLEREKQLTSLLTTTDELRRLIIDNPGVPLLVFAGEYCNSGEYTYTFCSGCNAALSAVIDGEIPNERVTLMSFIRNEVS